MYTDCLVLSWLNCNSCVEGLKIISFSDQSISPQLLSTRIRKRKCTPPCSQLELRVLTRNRNNGGTTFTVELDEWITWKAIQNPLLPHGLHAFTCRLPLQIDLWFILYWVLQANLRRSHVQLLRIGTCRETWTQQSFLKIQIPSNYRKHLARLPKTETGLGYGIP